jgi:hypothetical protein
MELTRKNSQNNRRDGGSRRNMKKKATKSLLDSNKRTHITKNLQLWRSRVLSHIATTYCYEGDANQLSHEVHSGDITAIRPSIIYYFDIKRLFKLRNTYFFVTTLEIGAIVLERQHKQIFVFGRTRLKMQ